MKQISIWLPPSVITLPNEGFVTIHFRLLTQAACYAAIKTAVRAVIQNCKNAAIIVISTSRKDCKNAAIMSFHQLKT